LLNENHQAPPHIREGELGVAQFAVRFAAPTYGAVRVSRRVAEDLLTLDDRFDKSGAV
jgi:hypothetical protein